MWRLVVAQHSPGFILPRRHRFSGTSTLGGGAALGWAGCSGASPFSQGRFLMGAVAAAALGGAGACGRALRCHGALRVGLDCSFFFRSRPGLGIGAQRGGGRVRPRRFVSAINCKAQAAVDGGYGRVVWHPVLPWRSRVQPVTARNVPETGRGAAQGGPSKRGSVSYSAGKSAALPSASVTTTGIPSSSTSTSPLSTAAS